MPHLVLLLGEPWSIKGLVQRALEDLGAPGQEVTRRSYQSWSDLLGDNSSCGLFAERSFVLVEVEGDLGPFPLHMTPLLEGPEADNVVLLAVNQLPKELSQGELKGRVSVYRDEPLPRFGRDRIRWIENQARGLGLSISSDGLAFISDAFEDREEISGELRKLSMLGRAVSLEDVRSLCLGDGQRNLVSFLDLLCARRDVEALTTLSALKRDQDLLPLVSATYNRFRLAFYAHRFGEGWVNRNLSPRPYAMKMAMRAVEAYPLAALRDFVWELIRINVMEKMGLGAGWARFDMAVFGLLNSSRGRR